MKVAMAMTALAALAWTIESADICQTKYCTQDDGTLCDRSNGGCPICLATAIGGKAVKCTTPNLIGTCSVLGIGGTKCEQPWKDPDQTPSPTTEAPSDPTTTPPPTDSPSTKAPKTTTSPPTTSPPTTKSPNTTPAPSTSKATPKPNSTQSTLTPSTTSQNELPTTQPANTNSDPNKKDESSSNLGTYIGIGVGAAALIAIVAFVLFRMAKRSEEEDEDEESSYKPTTAPAQYNPYANKQPSTTTTSELPAAVAAANLRAKLNQNNQPSEQAPPSAIYQNTSTPSQPNVIITEGSRQKSIHTDIWGNVPSSFREGGGGTELASNGSFMSDGSMRRTGNSANGEKDRDNETRLSVEF